MTRLTWDAPGSRYFEAGVDRGVLYTSWAEPVAWYGLTSIREAPSGGQPKPYYRDGIKYINIAAAEEYFATINAFTAPAEFGPCDGTASIANGLFATQQRRKSFNFSYRTGVGNDISSLDYGYKIHLVYNALAAPSSKDNNTLSNSVAPMSQSWAISTKPPRNGTTAPTAHFVIDSRHTPPQTLEDFEEIIYGSDEEDARWPDVEELITIFGG